MVKVAILTLFGQFNYGNRLQNHAVNSILSEYGVCPETLIYPDYAVNNIKKNLRRILGKTVSAADSMSRERKKRFCDFDANLGVRAVSSLRDINRLYDLIVVGSDQVWNPRYGNVDFTLLEKIPSGKIITLSPSFGVSDIPANLKGRYSSALARIDNLTVREQAGADLIKQLTGRDATVTIDPTLSISSDVWRSLASDELTPSNPYIFAYMLGRVDENQQRIIERIGAEYDAQVILLGTRAGISNVEPGPAEFISLIDNAERVVTDSFHAAAFSSMLKTPLSIVRRNEAQNSFSRIENLVSLLGIENALCEAGSQNISFESAYTNVDRVLESESQKLRLVLESSLRSAGVLANVDSVSAVM